MFKAISSFFTQFLSTTGAFIAQRKANVAAYAKQDSDIQNLFAELSGKEAELTGDIKQQFKTEAENQARSNEMKALLAVVVLLVVVVVLILLVEKYSKK